MTHATPTTTKRAVFTTLLFSFGIIASSWAFSAENSPSIPCKKYCNFTPPEKWEIVDAHSLSPKVLIGFLDKSNSGFCPSINLAVEDVDVSLSEYIQAVKELHEQDKNTRWRNLGHLNTLAGKARLTAIDTKTKWGEVRMLQMMIVFEGKAYILTAAAKKEVLAKIYPQIKKSFSTFSITSDLLSLVSPQDKKELLAKRIEQLRTASITSPNSSNETIVNSVSIEKEWRAFRDYLIANHSDLGTFWHLQLLEKLRNEMTP